MILIIPQTNTLPTSNQFTFRFHLVYVHKNAKNAPAKKPELKKMLKNILAVPNFYCCTRKEYIKNYYTTQNTLTNKLLELRRSNNKIEWLQHKAERFYYEFVSRNYVRTKQKKYSKCDC